MAADMNSIMVGYQGTQDMLSAIYGKPKSAEPAPSGVVDAKSTARKSMLVPVVVEVAKNLPPLTPSVFDQMFSRKEMR